MKKSKEFWVDQGYLDVLGSGQPAPRVVEADAVGAAAYVVGFFLYAAGVAVTGGALVLTMGAFVGQMAASVAGSSIVAAVVD